MKTKKNIAASIRQRLLNKAKRDNRSYNELLQYYCMERFLFRLSISKYASNYVLKGGLMLRVWSSNIFRPTMDIDLLGITANSKENIISQIRDIIHVNVEPDGVVFDSESIVTEQITENSSSKGIRIRLGANLDTALLKVQIDIGFGDIVYPNPKKEFLPSILTFDDVSLLCYSRESAIAEKFDAMIKHGKLNSRIKDFYDIWLLSRQFSFELNNLTEAIENTLKQRDTQIRFPIEVFEKSYISSHQNMWVNFRKRIKQDHIPDNFQVIVEDIIKFLKPFLEGITRQLHWNAAGPWVQ